MSLAGAVESVPAGVKLVTAAARQLNFTFNQKFHPVTRPIATAFAA